MQILLTSAAFSPRESGEGTQWRFGFHKDLGPRFRGGDANWNVTAIAIRAETTS